MTYNKEICKNTVPLDHQKSIPLTRERVILFPFPLLYFTKSLWVDKSHLGVLHKHQTSILHHCLGWTLLENISWGYSKGCLPTKQLVKMQTEQKKDILILFSRSYKRPLYTSAKEEKVFLCISWTFKDSHL